MSIKFKILLCIPLLFTLACGGGSAGDSNNTNGDNDGDTPTPTPEENSTYLNGGLPGKFFFQYHNEAYTMDVETGDYHRIPNTYWPEQTDVFDASRVMTYLAVPVLHNTTEFMLTANGNLISQIGMQQYTGNYLGEMVYFSDPVGSAYLSQDLQYVALFKKYEDTWLEIYTWDGRSISDVKLGERELIWLRDNRLLYTSGRSFYFTYPASADDEYWLELPETIQAGSIRDLAISPDETQIAFIVAESVQTSTQSTLNSRLYIVNIDGSNVRMVATTFNDDDPKLHTPQWSPDGHWIYIEEGDTILPGPDYPGGSEASISPDMYIVPTDDMGKVLYLSTNDSERSSEVRLFWRKQKISTESGGSVTNKAMVLLDSHLYWIPE
jgi:hypothetical protein